MKTPLKNALAGILSVGIIFALSIPHLAFASGNISITKAHPDPHSKNKSWFIFEAPAGDSVEETVLIKNLSSHKVRVKVYGIDADTNSAGRFILKFPHEPQETIGKWAQVESSELSLNPFEILPLNFQVTVPEGTSAGEYAGGIVVEEIPNTECTPTNNGCSVGATIQTRVGNRIYLTVPGDVTHKFAWNSFEKKAEFLKDSIYFTFNLKNLGNTVIRPTITIETRDMFGNKVSEINESLGELQPTTNSNPMIKWENPPILGWFKTTATLNVKNEYSKSSHDQTLTRELNFWIISWKAYALAIFGLLLLISGTILLVRKLKK